MPFYHWDDLTRKNLAKPSDSEGSIIIGENITLNRSISQPGKVARPHFHGCEQMINVVSGRANGPAITGASNATTCELVLQGQCLTSKRILSWPWTKTRR